MRRVLLVLGTLLTAALTIIAVHVAAGDPGVLRCSCRDEDGAGRIADPQCPVHESTVHCGECDVTLPGDDLAGHLIARHSDRSLRFHTTKENQP